MVEMAASARKYGLGPKRGLVAFASFTTLLFWQCHPASGVLNVTEFEGTGPMDHSTKTIYLGLFSAIRITVAGTVTDPEAIAASRYWAVPIMAKTALLAWNEGIILDPPPRKADYDFQVLVLDECASAALCSKDRTMQVMTRMMLGNKLAEQSFSPVAALIGGHYASDRVASVAGSLEVPFVGYRDGSDALSDKAEYPFYMRLIDANGAGTNAMLLINAQLNFTRVDIWICSVAELLDVREYLVATAPTHNLVASAIMVPQSEYTACPLPEGSDTAKAWQGMVRQSRSFGAHAHLAISSEKCPLYDMFHFLVLEGLVGRGHFWLGWEASLDNMYNRYQSILVGRMCPPDAPPEQQVPSTFRTALSRYAFDGYTWIASDNLSPRYSAWHNYFKAMKSRKNDIFEPWIASQISDDLFDDPQATLWRYPKHARLFDAVWTVLRGVNAMLLDHGPNFTGSQLQHSMRADRFEGLTGSVSFDANGDRTALLSVYQFRYNHTDSPDSGARRLSSSWAPTVNDQALADAVALMESGLPFPTGPRGLAQVSPARALSSCTAPSSVGDALLVRTYFSCLQNSCMDASSAFLKVATNNQIASCATAKAMIAGNCEFDISTMLPSLPNGTKFKNVCAAQCPCTAVCPAPASVSDLPLVAGYFGCLRNRCADAPASFLQVLTAGQVPNCVAAKATVGGNCEFELNALLPMLPPGTKFKHICAGQCPCQGCVAPVSLAYPDFLRGYSSCLKGKCGDAAPELLRAATGGQVPSCASAKALVSGNCETDLSAMLPVLPSGTTFRDLCAGQCQCASAPRICIAPAGVGNLTEAVEYFGCLQATCADAPNTFVTTLTGGLVASCAVAKAMAGGNCDLDLHGLLPALPAGTLFKHLCAAQCPCTAAGGPPSPAPALSPPAVPLSAVVKVGDFEGTTLVLRRRMLFFDKTPEVPPDMDLPCDPGMFYDSVSAKCLVCAAGTFTSTRGQSRCSRCSGGTFGDRAGQSMCIACAGGRYSLDGQTKCDNCARGNYTGDVQQTQCSRCLPGSYSDTEEAKECKPCGLGTYQQLFGQSSCERCPSVLVTQNVGSRSSSDCDCGPGYYRGAGGGCRSCAEDFPSATVSCAGFGAPPMIRPGFMTLSGSPIIYLCPARGDGCPGNVPVGTEACSPGGSGVACSKCAETSRYVTKIGQCSECPAWTMTIFWILVAIVVLGLALKLRPLELQYGTVTFAKSMKLLFGTVPLVQLADLFQFHSILGRTLLPWPNQEKDFFSAMSGILDLGAFSVECILGGDRDIYPLRHVILMNSLPAAFLFACVLLVMPALLFPPLRRFRLPGPIPAASTALALMLTFFMTVLNWALNLVFSMYVHPGDSGWSLRAFPHILLSNKIIGAMQGIAITSILLWCVGTLAFVIFLLYFLPRQRHNMFLRRCTLSLVARYNEVMTWWILVDLTLKTLTTITLSLFSHADSQLTWLTSIYACHMFVLTWLQPYRFKRHTITDSMLTLGKLLVLIFAMPLLSDEESRALGVSITTWAFYSVAGLAAVWCTADFILGRQCDMDYDEKILSTVWIRFARVLPVQHSIEELAEGHNMRLSNSSVDGSRRERVSTSLDGVLGAQAMMVAV